MKNNVLTKLCMLLLLTGGFLSAQAQSYFSPDDIDIPYQKFVLDNGLTLVVHEDHKAPIVAVNVWYHVGSKNEKPGRSGFAHLFEHLMFNGSENFNDDYFQALERIGGTDLNGTTNTDRTNYFQNVPLSALDQVLFLESDRMGHLLGAIDQEKLDEQRGVVQNEKRQGENQPYGRVYGLITENLWPAGHPYAHTVIGSMEDLNAASLEDVKEWFRTYYGAANAVLSIAGDVDAEEVKAKVEQYFGDIPAGPALYKPQVNVPERTGEQRIYLQDRVPEARINMAWVMPQWGTREAVMLDLASSVLSSGKNSRLYKKLIYDEQTASSAYAYAYPAEIAGSFNMVVNVKPGKSVADLEAATNQILQEFIENGPTDAEMERVKNQYFSSFIKGTERIGGFGGKSDVLAQNQVYGGSPDYYKTTLETVAEATPEEVRAAAEKWLSDGKLVVVTEPFPNYQASGDGVDRSKVPEVGETAKATFPDLQKASLKNGMNIVLARREGVPTVEMQLIFDAGYAADQSAEPGTAALAMNMMDEGTKSMTALEINEKLQMLGASLYTGSDLDASYVSMSTLKPVLEPSMDIMTDVLLNPAFPEEDFNRLKQQQISQIQREKSTPIQMALRVFPKFLYGEGHAYSLPLTGSGYESSVKEISLKDVEGFYSTWLKPNNATLMVVGDIKMDELKEMLEARLGKWKKGKVPTKNVPRVEVQKGRKLYLMDRPESQQSVIIAGHVIAPYGKVNEIARETMNKILGGEFTSRLNMNLREDKHWSYGARTITIDAKGQRPLIAYAPVQTDKTKESVQEIMKEMAGYVGENPATQEEFSKTRRNTVLQLPGRWETNSSVASSVSDIVKYGLPDDYYQNYGTEVSNLQLEDVRKVAREIIQPGAMDYFIVGDKDKVLEGLTELDFDEIIIIDADGKPLQPAGNIKLQSGK